MARRAFGFLIAVLLTGVAVLAAPADQVTVQEENGTYRVSAQFDVAAAPGVVLQVLSDYSRIPEFAPGVKRSVVRDRQENSAVVEQEAVSRVLLFSKRVHLLLAIEETGQSISFHDTCGQSFTSYAGSWRVMPAADGARVIYTLAARPAFDVPGFVLTRLLKKDSGELIANHRREIEKR
jgi:carbon monoxide dehydrogenase subunit G